MSNISNSYFIGLGLLLLPAIATAVTNAQETEEFEAVVQIPLSNIMSASGVHIASNIILTAAHVIDAHRSGKKAESYKGTYRNIKKHRRYRKGSTWQIPEPYDLALICTTDENNSFFPLASRSVERRRGIFVVGYGEEESEVPPDTFWGKGKRLFYGPKRKVGSNWIRETKNGVHKILGSLQGKYIRWLKTELINTTERNFEDFTYAASILSELKPQFYHSDLRERFSKKISSPGEEHPRYELSWWIDAEEGEEGAFLAPIMENGDSGGAFLLWSKDSKQSDKGQWELLGTIISVHTFAHGRKFSGEYSQNHLREGFAVDLSPGSKGRAFVDACAPVICSDDLSKIKKCDASL